MAESAAERVLCRVLEFQSEALDFYAFAQERCTKEPLRELFAALGRDKRRLSERLAGTYAAVKAGLSLSCACTLTENGHDGQPEAPLSRSADQLCAGEECVQQAQVLARAFELENACLQYLEQSLHVIALPEVRFFLQQALEEERKHWLLLADLKQYVQQEAGASG